MAGDREGGAVDREGRIVDREGRTVDRKGGTVDREDLQHLSHTPLLLLLTAAIQ
jgi:hypothetical protein